MIYTVLVNHVACIQILSSFLFLGKEELHLGEALFYKRMHGLKQKIYRWKQYNVKTTHTYYWNRYNVVETTTYKWNKYNAVSTTTYTWNKWNTTRSRQSYTELYNNCKGRIGAADSTHYYLHPCTEPTIKSGNIGNYYASTYTNGYASIYAPSIGNYYETQDIDENPRYGYIGVSSDRYPPNYDPSGSFFRIDSMEDIYQGTTDTREYRNVTGTYYKTAYKYVYIKGSTLQGTVSSTSSSAYPNGGVSGSYWYDGRTSSTSWSQGSTKYSDVTSTNSSAYPSNGRSGSYWYVSAGSTTSYSKGSTKYSDVSSANSSAYPDNGKSGSYWYVYSRSTMSYSQGSYIGDKLSTNRNEYPDNGKSGSYWYVFDGEA